MKEQKIIFREAVEVTDHNGKVVFSAKAGDVKTLPIASANRWVNRNKADEVAAKPLPTTKADKPKAPPKKKAAAK